MVAPGQHPERSGISRSGEDHEDAALDVALREVPRGALALSGLTVGLLLLAWLLMYALVFLPRGMVS